MDKGVDSMASYTKLESGWRVRVRRNGVSTSKMFPTKAMAQAWAAKEETDLIMVTAGVAIPNKTLKELFDEYLKFRPNSTKDAKRILNGLGPATTLKAFTSHFIRQWQVTRLTQVSSATVLRERKVISAAVNYGIKRLKWLKENPLHNLDPIQDGEARTSTWSDEDVERFCVAANYRSDQPCITDTSRVAAALLFSLETAMRSSEICRARREDLKGRVLHVPITKSGVRRDIPLSLKALAILDQLPEIDDTLFALKDASRDALFRKVRGRAGIEGDVNFHSARRTALTRLASTFDVMTLAKISGHANLQILIEHYYAPKMEYMALKMDTAVKAPEMI